MALRFAVALDVEQRLAVRRRVGAVEGREQALGRHDLERVLLRALNRAEVVDLVLDDRAAEAAAKLVAAVVLLLAVVDLLGVGLGIHRGVAEQLEEAAVQIVGAALGDDVHHAAVAAAVLGLGARGHEVEFLDRFEREQLQQAADGVVVVVAAVNLVVQVAAVAAVDLRRVLGALGRVRVVAEAHAGQRRREVRELAAVERQALDAADVDDTADRRDRRFNQRRGRGDGDRLRDVRNLQREVEADGLADVDDDALAIDGAETGELDEQVVFADVQRLQAIGAFSVRHGRTGKARGWTGGRDGRARNCGALIIGNASQNGAGRLLRKRRLTDH